MRVDPAEQRKNMVMFQITRRGIRDARVLAAMRRVPRDAFVARRPAREFAYEDSPLPIEEGQTISQPYIVALMVEALELAAADRVLEIGTGSGYAAAVLGAARAPRSYTIERHAAPGRARARAARAARLRQRATSAAGDGTLGWPEARPTTRSSSRPAARACRRRCASSSRSAAGW